MEYTGVCVIGAGTAGFAAASAARELGRDVRIVALPGPLGGTCILRGCMPAKTLLASTHAIDDVRAAEEVGVDVTGPHVDLTTVVNRKRELVEYFAADRRHELESYPLTRGDARFVDRNVIDVGGVRIAAEHFVIATGSHIAPPAIAGLNRCGYITSDDVLEMHRAPRRLLIIGGGPVGCEFAQYFARLGVAVTLVQDAATLLRNEDADVGAAIAAALRRDGVDVILDARVIDCERFARAKRVLFCDRDGVSGFRDVDEILLASGRVPQIGSLDLERAGIAVVGERLFYDEFLQTTNPAIFAAGDVLGRRCLVHVAEYTGRLAVRNALLGERVPADFDRFEAHAVFTEPEFASAGLTERQCRERGLPIEVRRHAFSDLGKALVSAEPEGFIKMIASPEGRLLGIAIVGAQAIDLIGEAIALIDSGATVQRVATMPHLHPTMAEIFARVADDFAPSKTQPAVDAPSVMPELVSNASC